MMKFGQFMEYYRKFSRKNYKKKVIKTSITSVYILWKCLVFQAIALSEKVFVRIMFFVCFKS